MSREYAGLNEEQAKEAKWLKMNIEQLETELREVEGKGDSGKTLIEPILEKYPEELQEKFRAELRADAVEEARKTKELQDFLPTVEIKWPLPPEQDLYLQTLNANVRKGTIKMGEEPLRRKLWQSYARCKAFLPSFLDHVPDGVWGILWRAQTFALKDEDPTWASRIITLHEDLTSVGKKLAGEQEFLYIEALIHEGRLDQAIAVWQDLGDIVKEHGQLSAEHELSGVRLFTSTGDSEKALQLAQKYLVKADQADSRILLPIIDTWLKRGDDTGMKHAWALYLVLKTKLGSDITMDDYDKIAMAFIYRGRTGLALAVFKDMMLTGQETNFESVQLFKKSLGLIEKAQASVITADDLNTVSLTALTVMPRKYQNKFFYGSWLKKLLGMGESDAAKSVIELMYERGVKPDSKHLNGIIGAWFRSGRQSDREKAERMAWAMIHERLDFVDKRRRRDDVFSPSISADVDRTSLPPHLNRTVSPANIETFALLLQHYSRRPTKDNVKLLQNAVRWAEIRPNHYFINHLLFFELRRGQPQAAWAMYKDMFSRVQPDLETFACLWECEKAHLESLVVRSNNGFPSPRRIMNEMMSWFSARSAPEQQLIRELASTALYNHIIRCFCLAKDLEGALVSLYALKDAFGFYPGGDTGDMISIYIARLGLGEEDVQKPGRSRRPKKSLQKTNVKKASAVFQLIAIRRREERAECGMDDEEKLDPEIKREERLYLVGEYLRTVIRRKTAAEESMEDNVERAASAMGVRGTRMDDPLSSYPGYQEQKGSVWSMFGRS